MYEILKTDTFANWFSSLRDSKAKAQIEARTRRMGLGNFGDYKSVGDKVLELRIDCGQGYRIYFKRTEKTVILLLCGGNKSTQQADILTAKKIAKEC